MKIQRTFRRSSGFTLIELMVAMAVTTMIVTILVSITAISLDTWTRSRSEVRAARQAKAMADTMARDLEALVVRRGTNTEWLSAISAPVEAEGKPPSIESSNAANLIFYTSPTDRYEGDLSNEDSVGDVSCVGYQLKYRDPIQARGGDNIPTFVLYRLLVNPDETYEKLLSLSNSTSASLESNFNSTFQADLDNSENFVCENVFQFTVTLNISVDKTAPGQSASPPVIVPITLGNQGASANQFRLISGDIMTNYTSSVKDISDEDVKAGTLTSVEVSITVLTDFGVDQMRKRGFQSPQDQADFLAKNSYQYSKLVQVPTH